MMKEIVINNCPACKPINNLLEKLINLGIDIMESRVEDYHFHQLYFKVNSKINILKEIDISGFTLKDNFLICDCHWSQIEFFQNKE